MGSFGLSQYLLLVTLIPLLLVSEARPAERHDDPTVAGLGSTFCYEPLRGDLSETQGYEFTLSPNEEWILVLKLHTSPAFSHYYSLDLLHQPTSKLWTHRFEGPHYSPTRQWFPNSFSKDSDLLYHGKMAAKLSPDMETLVLAKSEKPVDMEHFEGSFLGFDRPIKNRKGTAVKAWWSLQQDEGQWGEIAWNYRSDVLFESVSRRRSRASFVRVSPPGANRGLNYQHVLQEENDHLGKIFAEDVQEAIRDARDKAEAERIRKQFAGFTDLFKVSEASVTIRLSQLAVSPDEKFLAGIAAMYRGSVGDAGKIYGVLIPLDRGGLAAFPFSRNVYGKILWGKNSRRIYYYAQRVAGGGKGTVCRLDFDPERFPQQITEAPLPE